MFTKELDYFIKHQEKLVKQFDGKVLAIKGESVIGVFDDVPHAYTTMKESNELGKAMIQPCSPGKDAYTVSVASVGVLG